jgi:parvulin-like peptidyl-prolyl isomerase
MKPGEIAPVLTPKGLQLVQLAARRAGKGVSFEEAAPEIRKMLTRRDMDKRAAEWLKGFREKATIKIML